MGVQWQVVGQQIDVMRQQQSQPLFEPSGHATVVTAPKQSMVNEQSIRIVSNGGFNQSATGSHARNDFFYFRAPFDLQTVRAIVFEQLRLQQLIAISQYVVAMGHVNAVPI
jgi:hypothetical protein